MCSFALFCRIQHARSCLLFSVVKSNLRSSRFMCSIFARTRCLAGAYPPAADVNHLWPEQQQQQQHSVWVRMLSVARTAQKKGFHFECGRIRIEAVETLEDEMRRWGGESDSDIEWANKMKRNVIQSRCDDENVSIVRNEWKSMHKYMKIYFNQESHTLIQPRAPRLNGNRNNDGDDVPFCNLTEARIQWRRKLQIDCPKQ